jgi:hypothetical protein
MIHNSEILREIAGRLVRAWLGRKDDRISYTTMFFYREQFPSIPEGHRLTVTIRLEEWSETPTDA